MCPVLMEITTGGQSRQVTTGFTASRGIRGGRAGVKARRRWTRRDLAPARRDGAWGGPEVSWTVGGGATC